MILEKGGGLKGRKETEKEKLVYLFLPNLSSRLRGNSDIFFSIWHTRILNSAVTEIVHFNGKKRYSYMSPFKSI